jgi:hypothetical protein
VKGSPQHEQLDHQGMEEGLVVDDKELEEGMCCVDVNKLYSCIVFILYDNLVFLQVSEVSFPWLVIWQHLLMLVVLDIRIEEVW